MCKTKGGCNAVFTILSSPCIGWVFQVENDHYTTAESAAELEHVIEIFGTRYRILYPLAPVRPKLHFHTYLVEQIPKFGSMHGVNCCTQKGSTHGLKICTQKFQESPYVIVN